MRKMLVNTQNKAFVVGGNALVIDYGNLPTGYTRLRYVYNSADTYINTGIRPTVDNIVLELKCKPSDGSWYILQSRETQGAAISGISGATGGSRIQMGNNGTSIRSDITRDTSHTYLVRASYHNGTGTLYVRDETAGVEDTKTDTYTFAEFPVNLYIWGNHAGNRVNANNQLYYVKITVGGSLVLDYVPALYNNVAGFYDNVSGQFVGASGGTINAGPVDE